MATRAGLGTGVALISITPDGENAIVVGPGANASLAHDDVVAACAGARVVLAQTEVGAEPVVWAAGAAAASGARLVLSTAPVVPLPAAVLEAADPLVVNASEATEVLHGPGAAAEPGSAVPSAADLVRHTGARSVVVTLGGAGADVADRHGSTRVPAPEVQVVDTTGAGDVFAGALAARLAGPDSTLMGAARSSVGGRVRVRHPARRPLTRSDRSAAVRASPGRAVLTGAGPGRCGSPGLPPPRRARRRGRVTGATALRPGPGQLWVLSTSNAAMPSRAARRALPRDRPLPRRGPPASGPAARGSGR